MSGRTMLSIGIAAVCAVYLYSAWQLPIGTLGRPGSGFFPIILGVLGVALAVIDLVMTGRKREGGGGPTRNDVIKIGGSMAAVLAFTFLLETLGGMLSLFLLILAFAKLCGMPGKTKPAVLALITAVTVYSLFALMFKVPIPQGVLGLF